VKKIEKSIELGGRKLTLKTGVLAEQASGAILAQYGETVVLATVVAAPLKQDLGYFPLTVDYQERLYAGGRIKGSRWVKREGRPSDDEILSARLIDRSLRPLFPKNYPKEIQIIITVLSVDMENDPTEAAVLAASAAVAISLIPWKGPVATLTVGKKNGTYFVNPTDSEMAFSEMDLVVSTTDKAIIMVEAGAKEVSEEAVLGGIEFGQKEGQKVIALINDLVKVAGETKEEFFQEKTNLELETKIKKLIGKTLDFSNLEQIKIACLKEFSEEKPNLIVSCLENIFKKEGRKLTLSGKRIDKRKPEEIRELASQAGVLPRTHGSAIFQRGQTQVLSVTTLGAPSLKQLIESAEGEESKRYMHHYSMPPFAMGETGKFGFPNRREIGHGALAERALLPVIPLEDKFPYTIRVVSEVTSSNGSTSMASVCGSTLSLMDAGVPIASPVSGIAMGLVIEDKKHVVLSDINGMEDFLIGDMDFKVAGTEKGITAMQLDVKSLDLTTKILKEALKQAKKGRETILASMLKTLAKPREKVSSFAPKIKVVKVPVEKIGEVIGPGGRMIKKIIAETGAQVDVEDDGTVNISGMNEAGVADAVSRVEALIKEVAAGEIYEGEVKRIQPFGAFVEILPGKDGLVHVSDMAEGFVQNPEEVVKIGQKVQVRVKEIDDLGRINLSMRMDPSTDKPKEPHFSRQGRDSRGMDRPRRFSSRGRSAFGRGSGGGFSRDRNDRDGARGGPHFPTSRLMGEKKDFSR
jgi:polyribonucleotide nucleotidyltransferase